MNNGNPARAERDKRIVKLRELGWAQQAIADEVGCSRQTVTKVLNPSLREREREYRNANADRLRERDRQRQRQPDARERQLQYRRVNAPRKAAYDREYRRANADRIAAYQANYRVKNAAKVQERNQRYRHENRVRLLEHRRKRWAAQATALNALRRDRYDDATKARVDRYRRAHLAEHRAAHGRRKMRTLRKMDATDRLLSAEYRKAIHHGPCVYCGASSEHDDHKLPLVRGGTDHWWNIQRTCKDCNFRKHTMTHEEFLASGKIPVRAA